MPKKCSICIHAEHEAIDAAILNGEPLRVIAQRFVVSRDALYRHKSHVSATVAKAHEAGEVAEADRLLSTVRDLLQAAIGTIAQAESGGDLRTKLAAIREARETAKLLLEVHGELQTAPTVNLIVAPEWVKLRTVILQTLNPFPDARACLIEAIARVER